MFRVRLAYKKFEAAATNTLGETVMATPALADGVLLFRTRENLIAISEKELKTRP